jgi:5'-3' exonuclease
MSNETHEITGEEQKEKLFKLFANMQEENSTFQTRQQNSEILIVDGLNTFFRCFMGVPTLNENGLHVGGIAGFLKSVGYAAKLFSPTRIVIVFDGTGGSAKRRKIYPEYKQQRKTKLKYNRAYEELTTAELEDQNIQTQLLRLVGYLDALPVTVISVDQIEADDTIAYLSQQYFKDSRQVTIMSSDKDFLQLVDNRVKVWSPTKKKLYASEDIFNEYGIHSENFINFRILSGDESDNIDGVSGAGLKTILKCFPQMKESTYVTTEQIYQHAEQNKKKYKLYNSILENKSIVERNLQLMQLKNTEIPPFTQLRIVEILNKKVPSLNMHAFVKLVNEDHMRNCIPNSYSWLKETFGSIIIS